MVKDPKKKANRALKSVLGKLGIKSAARSSYQEIMEDMVENTLNSFGRPDEIFMSGSALETFMEAMAKEKK